jgi:Uma2 family endonuclease
MTGTLDVPVEVDRPPPPPPPISFEEFMAWADEDTHAEWVDGEIVLMSPANIEHQDLIGFLFRLISQFVDTHRLGRVFVAGVLMRLRTRPSGREPDLLFVANEHADRLRETYVDGPADLVVEIVSPDSTSRDRGEKYAEYEAAPVPEYWVVDPLRRDAQLNVLGEDGRYHLAPLDADGFYHSTILAGFRLQVDWLWQRPLPPIAEVLDLIEA